MLRCATASPRTGAKPGEHLEAFAPLFDLIEHPERYEGCLAKASGFFGLDGASSGEW